ncbi:hypothetical protein FPCIR_7849 [Fusarium pseudocircinatum]|uniref:Uncharacterized protein n=1 Tax=Fusarium pseudocircinatum TaxID=56676 RepID=A0A8H5L9D1_9HYPO|nr:hypothetical protein FPCIR_7849 [Fusarium pseudocircinatum]
MPPAVPSLQQIPFTSPQKFRQWQKPFHKRHRQVRHRPSGDTTAVTETGTDSSGSATEATAGVSYDNRSESRSDTGAIVSGVVGGLAVVCETAVAVIYLLRKSHAQKLETTLETGQEMTEAPGQTETDNGPKELAGSKPSDVPANRHTAELQETLALVGLILWNYLGRRVTREEQVISGTSRQGGLIPSRMKSSIQIHFRLMNRF